MKNRNIKTIKCIILIAVILFLTHASACGQIIGDNTTNSVSESTTEETNKISRSEALDIAKKYVTLEISRHVNSYKYLEYATIETDERYNSWKIKLAGNFMAYDKYGTPTGTYIFEYDLDVPGVNGEAWTVWKRVLRPKY